MVPRNRLTKLLLFVLIATFEYEANGEDAPAKDDHGDGHGDGHGDDHGDGHGDDHGDAPAKDDHGDGHGDDLGDAQGDSHGDGHGDGGHHSIFQLTFKDGLKSDSMWVILILILIFTLIVEHCHSYIESSVANSKSGQMFVERMNGEIMMFGIVGIGIIMYVNLVGQMDQHLFHTFEFCHVLVSVSAIVLLMLGLLLFWWRKRLESQWSFFRAKTESIHLQVQGDKFESGGEYIEYFIMASRFMEAHPVPEDFCFTQFLHESLSKEICDLMECGLTTWMTLISVAVVFYILNLIKVAGDTSPMMIMIFYALYLGILWIATFVLWIIVNKKWANFQKHLGTDDLTKLKSSFSNIILKISADYKDGGGTDAAPDKTMVTKLEGSQPLKSVPENDLEEIELTNIKTNDGTEDEMKKATRPKGSVSRMSASFGKMILSDNSDQLKKKSDVSDDILDDPLFEQHLMKEMIKKLEELGDQSVLQDRAETPVIMMKTGFHILVMLQCFGIAFYLMHLLHNIGHEHIGVYWHAVVLVLFLSNVGYFLPKAVALLTILEAYISPDADIMDYVIHETHQFGNDCHFINAQIEKLPDDKKKIIADARHEDITLPPTSASELFCCRQKNPLAKLHNYLLNLGLQIGEDRLLRLQKFMDRDMDGAVSVNEFFTSLHARNEEELALRNSTHEKNKELFSNFNANIEGEENIIKVVVTEKEPENEKAYDVAPINIINTNNSSTIVEKENDMKENKMLNRQKPETREFGVQTDELEEKTVVESIIKEKIDKDSISSTIVFKPNSRIVAVSECNKTKRLSLKDVDIESVLTNCQQGALDLKRMVDTSPRYSFFKEK